MPDTAVNRRKGTTAQHATAIGVLAETSYDTTLKRLVAHDGATPGGFPAAMLHLEQTFAQDQHFSERILLPNTTSAAIGGIYFGGSRAFHNFGTLLTNIFVGVNAGNFTLTSSSTTACGVNSGTALTSGASNSFFGRDTGMTTTSGSSNTFFGRDAGRLNLDGNLNCFFGRDAGIVNTSGSSSCFFGRGAGSANTTGGNNICIGATCGDNITTGSNNIVLGFDIDSPTATNSNTLTIGNLIFGTGINGVGVGISTGNIGIAVITPTSGLHLGRSFATPYRAISATDTFAATDYTINVTSGTFTLNLPTAVGITGRIYVAKNSGVGTITLDPAGAELIDGLATAAIAPGASITTQSTGAGWIII